MGAKDYNTWVITFTKNEKDFLFKRFEVADKENYVVLVCANSDFRNTCFVIIPFEKACSCLGTDNINSSFRISVKHKKGSKYLEVYGTARARDNSIKIKHNPDSIFGFDK